MLAGAFDFIGMNFYTSDIVFPQECDDGDCSPDNPTACSYYCDQDIGSTQVRISYTIKRNLKQCIIPSLKQKCLNFLYKYLFIAE